MLENIKNKFICQKHNTPLHIETSDDGYAIYICNDCNRERYLEE